MSDEQAWDSRYAENEHIWSGKPNEALVAEVSELRPGRALDLGCGEGADAVWLAKQGWDVTAVDISSVALGRAAAHATEAGVRVTFEHHNLEKTFPSGTYDLVTAQFLHFWEDFPREKILRSAAEHVAPGGTLLVEGHMDPGPFHHDHGHSEKRFPSPDEVIGSLELDDTWEIQTNQVHPRTQTGPDGNPATRTDSTVKLRRRA
jgi:SAM-dependent methyltransferase